MDSKRLIKDKQGRKMSWNPLAGRVFSEIFHLYMADENNRKYEGNAPSISVSISTILPVTIIHIFCAINALLSGNQYKHDIFLHIQ